MPKLRKLAFFAQLEFALALISISSFIQVRYSRTASGVSLDRLHFNQEQRLSPLRYFHENVLILSAIDDMWILS
jgi:hypothetical protein